MRSLQAVLCLSILLIVLSAVSANPPIVYTETFTTATYMDAAETDAWWDTSTGELKLYPFGMTLMGGYHTPGTAWAVDISADRAYVASWQDGLQIVDIGEPSNPLYLGSYNTPGLANGVLVEGTLAFVADYSYGLQIVDVATPAAPAYVGDYNTPGSASGIDVRGDYAYIADRGGGLQIIDVRDPSIPVAVGSYTTADVASDVVVEGALAYVADQIGGLAIVDVSNPSSPSQVGTYVTPTYCYGVAVSGDHAYLACYSSGLVVVDISDPANPSQASTLNTPGLTWRVDVDGDFVYLADGSNGVVNVDITDPTAPVLEETIALKDWAYDVNVAGEFAFVADRDSGLTVVHVAQVVDPPIAVGNWNTPSLAYAIDVAGDHAFVGDNVGLEIIDVSDPGTPTRIGSYDTPGPIRGVVAAGDLVYLAETDLGDFEVVDISDPSSPTLVGSYNNLNSYRDLDVAGDHAFVPDSDGLVVLDVRNPANPTEVTYLLTTGFAAGIDVAGDYAYIADSGDGLKIVDISTPASPVLVGSYNGPGSYVKVVVDWNHAYVAAAASGLHVIDVSDPTSPAYMGGSSPSDISWGLAVAGDFAFVAEGTNGGSGGLRVIDIRDPSAPAILGAYPLPDDARAVAVAGNNAFVADDGGGLRICQVYERNFDLGTGRAQSLQVYDGPYTVRAVRINSQYTGGVTWWLNAVGNNWQGYNYPDRFFNLIEPGEYLRWRADLLYTQTGVNPTVTDLQLELLFDWPSIDAITDIPNDQGKQVRITWTRSGHDAGPSFSPTPVTEYSIFRRIDWDLTAMSNVPSEYPPGDWEYITTVPAYYEDDYTVVVPTLADSTIDEGMYYTTFFLRAGTDNPTIRFDSEPDSGYSVDNLVPSAPTSFSVAYNSGGGTQLSWDECPDEDFDYFRIYRGTTEEFTPGPGSLHHATTGTEWFDAESGGGEYHYKITAVDFSGNESDASSAGTVTDVGGPSTPAAFALHPNTPNPFNPSTVVSYDVPESGGAVTVRVYDAGGRLVRTLVDEMQSPGRKRITWNGRDDRAAPVASGVYFCRMTAPGFDQTQKMLLLK